MKKTIKNLWKAVIRMSEDPVFQLFMCFYSIVLAAPYVLFFISKGHDVSFELSILSIILLLFVALWFYCRYRELCCLNGCRTIYFKNGRKEVVRQEVVNIIQERVLAGDKDYQFFTGGDDGDTWLLVKLSEVSHIA